MLDTFRLIDVCFLRCERERNWNALPSISRYGKQQCSFCDSFSALLQCTSPALTHGHTPGANSVQYRRCAVAYAHLREHTTDDPLDLFSRSMLFVFPRVTKARQHQKRMKSAHKRHHHYSSVVTCHF